MATATIALVSELLVKAGLRSAGGSGLLPGWAAEGPPVGARRSLEGPGGFGRVRRGGLEAGAGSRPQLPARGLQLPAADAGGPAARRGGRAARRARPLGGWPARPRRATASGRI